MNVLLINDGDRGGSVVAMTRLHLGLKKAGVRSTILNRVNPFGSPDVAPIPRSRFMARVEHELGRVTGRVGLNDVHCLSTFRLKELPAYQSADVLDFHTIHGGFFNYLAVPSLTREKPGVLTLHDMWFLTGHCTYSYNCERWKTGCGQCPHPDVPPAIRRDGTRWEWKLKNWVYGRSSLVVVSPSKWLFDRARESMLNRLPIYYIPHGVDVEVYRPLERELCRSLLGIPKGRKVVMFSAMRMDLSDSHSLRKGCDLLLTALKGLPESLRRELTLLLLGEGGEGVAEAVGIHTVDLGYLASDRLKAVAYSASDLFVFPTRADIFGLVLLESLACGTPLVSFDVCGVPELVRSGSTGYLAEPGNADDFRDGILKLLSDDALRHQMARRCREIAVAEYPINTTVNRYIELYTEIANKNGMSGTSDRR